MDWAVTGLVSDKFPIVQQYFQQSGIDQWTIDHQHYLAVDLEADRDAIEDAQRRAAAMIASSRGLGSEIELPSPSPQYLCSSNCRDIDEHFGCRREPFVMTS